MKVCGIKEQPVRNASAFGISSVQRRGQAPTLPLFEHIACRLTWVSRRTLGWRKSGYKLGSIIEEGKELIIHEEACRRVNLGFLDHRKFRLDDYQTDLDTLVVEDAGRDYYLV